MTTKQQAYDHPAYEVPIVIGNISTAGANAISGKFAAFTAMIMKSATVTVNTAGTNTTTVAVCRISAAGTATTTMGSYIVGTGVVTGTSIGTATMQSANFSLGTTTVAQGDIIGFNPGVDATLVCAVGIEAYVVPGANLTV